VTLRPFFRKPARLEYDEATVWYESQRTGLGGEFVSEIDRAVLRVCEAPEQFPIVLRDIRCVRVRRFPYSLFFRVRSGRIVVLSVFHARRDPLIWRERR
jgi:plasmid stabilization system protein ParE